jgi:hypothetical protein
MSDDRDDQIKELIDLIDEILKQEYILPPVEDDPEGCASVYFSGFDDGLRACQGWFIGDEDMLRGRLNK